MKHIDEAKLETDLEARFAYVADFIGFTAEDAALIHASAAQFAPKIATVVEKTYDKLLAYDATARHFVPRQHGYSGPLPDSLESLDRNDAQIRFRKEHLSRYLMRLVGHAYDAKMVTYLDMVGKMHTSLAGNSQINVPLLQMNALLGLLSDILIETLGTLDLADDVRLNTIRAYTKLLWIQNDLISRHYQRDAIRSDEGRSADKQPGAAGA